MSFSNTFETDLLSLLFTNVNIALLGDATGVRGSATAGSLYAALHTADPGEAGDQTTSESAYTGYARIAISRDTGSWTVSSNAGTGQVVNNNTLSWGQCTANPATVMWVSVGLASSGASKILARMQITSPAGGQSLVVGAIPTITAGNLKLTLD